MNEPQKLYWHWLPEDQRLRYDSRQLVVAGETITHNGPVVMCESGLHASERAIDSLQYAPGPIICRVTLGGFVAHGIDKSVASERTVLWMADATNTLHEFACRCAEDALRTAKVEDVRCWQAIETKRKWLRGEATDAELDAAWDAAWAAAWDAARDAARAAARAAARDAAWDAAWDAQNTRLTDMLLALEPKEQQ